MTCSSICFVDSLRSADSVLGRVKRSQVVRVRCWNARRVDNELSSSGWKFYNSHIGDCSSYEVDVVVGVFRQKWRKKEDK